MSNDTCSFFASYIPEDEPVVGPILDLIEKQGHRVERHPDTTMFSDLPAFISIRISECDFYIAFMSDKYSEQAAYSQEPLIVRRMRKPVLAVLLDNSAQAAALSRNSDPALTYDYAHAPDTVKTVEAIMSVFVKKPDSIEKASAEAKVSIARSQLLMGLKMYRQCSYELAVILFKEAAEHGNKQALFHLGICYLNGHGTDKNPEQAYSCFSRAAAAGIPDAQYYTARLLLEGTGTNKNEPMGLYFLYGAVENNHPEALTLLSKFYYYGSETVEKDTAFAITLLEKAAAQNHREAIDFLKKITNDSTWSS